jgi:hypothetical protein
MVARYENEAKASMYDASVIFSTNTTIHGLPTFPQRGLLPALDRELSRRLSFCGFGV